MSDEMEKKEINLITQICQELGITQKELAEKTGYARETLSRWKSSNDIPKSAENHLILLMKYNKFEEIENLIKLK
jgi:transcriptional regulator with XRE-family HTH domain